MRHVLPATSADKVGLKEVLNKLEPIGLPTKLFCSFCGAISPTNTRETQAYLEDRLFCQKATGAITCNQLFHECNTLGDATAPFQDLAFLLLA